MGSAFGFGDDVVDATEIAEVSGGDAHGFGGELFLGGVAPHDGGAAFGRDDRVDRVFHHENAIGYRDGERAAAATYADNGCNDRNLQAGHLAQVVGDGFGLSALFGLHPGICAVSVDQGEDRAAEFFRDLHDADRFAVSLGMGRAEVTVDALLHVAPLLRGDEHDFFAVEAGHAADDGGIVAEAAVSVNFAEVREDALDVVERLGALRMSRQFGLLPGAGRGVHFAAQGLDAVLELGDLPLHGSVGIGGLHFGDLALDLLEFLLHFFCRGHIERNPSRPWWFKNIKPQRTLRYTKEIIS